MCCVSIWLSVCTCMPVHASCICICENMCLCLYSIYVLCIYIACTGLHCMYVSMCLFVHCVFTCVYEWLGLQSRWLLAFFPGLQCEEGCGGFGMGPSSLCPVCPWLFMHLLMKAARCPKAPPWPELQSSITVLCGGNPQRATDC